MKSVADDMFAPDAYPAAAANGRLSYAIFLLARAHRGYADRLLNEFGLQAGHEHILLSLYGRDGQSRSELLEFLGLDDPTIAEAIDCLVQVGAVRLETPSSSGSVYRVWLTDKGRAMQEPIRTISAKMEASALEVLGDRATEFVATAKSIEDAIEHQ